MLPLSIRSPVQDDAPAFRNALRSKIHRVGCNQKVGRLPVAPLRSRPGGATMQMAEDTGGRAGPVDRLPVWGVGLGRVEGRIVQGDDGWELRPACGQ
jgi:hypothetical protein